MVLQTNEYDISYFDGAKATLRHNAGYSNYERWIRDGGENSLGEFWKDKAKELFDTYSLNGKKVLELGCAKGFIVEDLREMGVDCYGLDVSSYAIGEATDIVKPFLTIADAKTGLSKYKDNEFDIVFSLRFLECFEDVELTELITEINRISKFQFHLVDESGNETYYIIKSLDEWIKYNFSKETVIYSNQRDSSLVK
ncbi:MAG: class I SAM-dependent methyltransferase [Patescibacteria group bacterium]|nr:class I SAM-dependent methyltransferase [Patescibacteria group bacterium]